MRHFLLFFAIAALAAVGCNTGERGPTGEMGEMGLPGLEGPEGPAGPEGPEGPQGSDGSLGPAGPQGIQGPDGVVVSYSVDANFTSDVPVITIGTAYRPASCSITHTAGPNEVALIKMQVTVQFNIPDIVLLAPSVDDGTGFVYAVTHGELAGTGTLNVANVSSTVRIPLVSGRTYRFRPGVSALHDAGTNLSVALATCHATVAIVTEGTTFAPLVDHYSDTIINPITGEETRLE